METQENPKKKEAPVPPVKPAGAKKSHGCLWGILGVLVGMLLVPFLAIGGIALAVSATGVVKVPVLSSIFKAPPIAEDFSYKKVSDKQLNKKLESAMSGTEGNVKATVTLTDDEVNTLISGMFSSPDSFVQNLLVKFSPGVVKIKGELSDGNAPFYAEIRLAKSADSFVFEVQKARLGALPLPGFLIEGLIGQVVGTGQLLGKPSAESLPVDAITVREGSIVIKGLDLSGLGPPSN